jgi:hypothetical protein
MWAVANFSPVYWLFFLVVMYHVCSVKGVRTLCVYGGSDVRRDNIKQFVYTNICLHLLLLAGR